MNLIEKLKYLYRRRQLLKLRRYGVRFDSVIYKDVRDALDILEHKAFIGEIPKNAKGICSLTGFMGVKKINHNACLCFLSMAREYNRVHGFTKRPWVYPVDDDSSMMTWEDANLQKRLKLMQWIIHTIDTYDLDK